MAKNKDVDLITDSKIFFHTFCTVQVSDLLEYGDNKSKLSKSAYKNLERNDVLYQKILLEAVSQVSSDKVIDEFKKAEIEDLEKFMEINFEGIEVDEYSYEYGNCPRHEAAFKVPISFDLEKFKDFCKHAEKDNEEGMER